MSGWTPDPAGSTRWISREFGELLTQPERWSDRPQATAKPFDVLIVGSGYGAAVAAAELAGCQEGERELSVCVLERGREYLPGSFPARMADLPGQVRGNFAGRVRGGEVLFDVRVGGDVSVVLANGLGGGSLINAGVMRRPDDSVFDDKCWPRALRREGGAVPPLEEFYGRMERQLGAWQDGEENTIRRHANPALRKRAILDRMSTKAEDAALTIAMRDGQTTTGGVKLNACKQCGDCATGCNYGAKESLDTNLLVTAFRAGAAIYCGATVLRLQRPPPLPGGEPGESLWCVLVTHTEEKLRLREGGPRWIAARKVILAAGSLGSTEILMRSQREPGGPRFSELLGHRFSTNGDMAAVGYNYTGAEEAGAIANEDDLPDARRVGPTITGMIPETVKIHGKERRILIQEMSVAGPLRRAFEEAVTTANVLHGLEERDASTHRDGHPDDDPFAVQPDQLRRTSAFAVMGDDGAGGRLRLGADDGDQGIDGHVLVDWPEAKKKVPLFDAQIDKLTELSGGIRGAGRTMPNPLWRFLSKPTEEVIGMPRGPLLTVHPLGGCPMGDSVDCGVVNEHGRVFDAAARQDQPFHDGLMVLDGSIVPMALSANPALTIAALTLRAVEALRGTWTPPSAAGPASESRPQLADIAEEIKARPPAETRVEFTERLSGAVSLDGQRGQSWVEITLTYVPLPIDQLFRPDATGALSGAKLTVDETKGRLRLFSLVDWKKAKELQGSARESFEKRHSRTYALTGTLTILKREASTPCQRIWRSACAWVRNRGLRDACGWVRDYLAGRPTKAGEFEQIPAFASHAGEVRTFEYKLKIGDQVAAGKLGPALIGKSRLLSGHKRITYARPSNPWRQLQEMTLTQFPGLASKGPAVLRLDQRYLASKNQPLFGIVSQRDHAEALADIASLGAYFLRMLVSIHFWSARKPDPPAQREIVRLPGRVPGLSDPEIHEIEVDQVGGTPVHIRLTRYAAGADPDRAPVVLIHGYSASGTTYAHPSLKPGLAPFLAQQGKRDVWVVDLRSSSGLPTATRPWTMERVALMDIPAAIDYVCQRTGKAQVDVVAHCMGAVMLSMAILSADKHALADEIWTPADRSGTDRFRAERAALQSRIRRVVLSQNGPGMVMTDPNIFRTYVFSFMEDVLRPLPYAFRAEPDQNLAWELLDRLFATLPYEDEELKLENSPCVLRSLSHLGVRHRMDALYGRTFSLANLSKDVLRDIDDFFGPFSLVTLGQVLHFGRLQTIANRAGRNRFVNLQTLCELWRFRTLVIHGEENGMADVATLYRIDALLREAGCAVTRLSVKKFGHQDCLIGRDAPAVIFPELLRFLDAR